MLCTVSQESVKYCILPILLQQQYVCVHFLIYKKMKQRMFRVVTTMINLEVVIDDYAIFLLTVNFIN